MRIHAGLTLLLATASLAGPAFAEPARAGAVASSASKADQDEPVAPKRTKVTCAQYRANVDDTAKHAIFNTRIQPGSWGRVPPELRKLPHRSRLCGADSLGQVVIASPLFGKELESYYAPLLAKIGFEPLKCAVEHGKTQCRCKRHRDVGILVTDENNEAFVLAVVKRR